ncbi:uncharacterized protein VP01_929g3 [Puccinia sorghi]|uniref:Uncharacterized protein n=1 Tax=Puccinia sorghi TaxID=27349 RepID=A0A0L6U734_9BASI|nr:uncharacterized protein VP01_929g3 [Puccinia sorghi]
MSWPYFPIQLAISTCLLGANGNGAAVLRIKNLFQDMQEEGFPGSIGFMDGTTIPLSQKPPIDGNYYSDCKKRSGVTNSSVISNSETTLY